MSESSRRCSGGPRPENTLASSSAAWASSPTPHPNRYRRSPLRASTSSAGWRSTESRTRVASKRLGATGTGDTAEPARPAPHMSVASGIACRWPEPSSPGAGRRGVRRRSPLGTGRRPPRRAVRSHPAAGRRSAGRSSSGRRRRRSRYIGRSTARWRSGPAIAVAAEMVKVVVALEHPVVTDDPDGLVTHVGGEDGGRDRAVIVRGQYVADVVEQRGDDELARLAVAQRPRGGLAAVASPVDPVAQIRALEQPEGRKQVPHERPAGVVAIQPVEAHVVIGGALAHARPPHGECLAHACSLPAVRGHPISAHGEAGSDIPEPTIIPRRRRRAARLHERWFRCPRRDGRGPPTPRRNGTWWPPPGRT